MTVSSAIGSVHVRGWSARLGALIWDNTTILSPSSSSEVSLRAALVPWLGGVNIRSPSKVSAKSEKGVLIACYRLKRIERFCILGLDAHIMMILCRRPVCSTVGEHSPDRCARRTEWTLTVRRLIPAECRRAALLHRRARPAPRRDLRH